MESRRRDAAPARLFFLLSLDVMMDARKKRFLSFARRRGRPALFREANEDQPFVSATGPEGDGDATSDVAFLDDVMTCQTNVNCAES